MDTMWGWVKMVKMDGKPGKHGKSMGNNGEVWGSHQII